MVALVIPSTAPVTGSAPSLPAIESERSTGSCGPRYLHPPIRITEEQGPHGFVLGRESDGDPIYRPGSGVVAGNGTTEDPYVIAGWCTSWIDEESRAPDAPRRAGIAILGTDASVVVRDIFVRGPPSALAEHRGTGVLIRDAANVTLEENRIDRHDVGVALEEVSRNVTVARNNLSGNDKVGVAASRSRSVTITGNTFVDHGVASIGLFSTVNGSVRNNTVRGTHLIGIVIGADDEPGRGNRILANRIVGNTYGVSMWGTEADEAEILGNTIAKNELVGVSVGITGADHRIRDNRIRGNGVGITFGASSHDNTVINNTIADNEDRGLVFRQEAKNNTVSGNTIADNGEHGIALNDALRTAIANNTIHNHATGIRLDDSAKNQVEHNTILDNGIGVRITGEARRPAAENRLVANAVRSNAIGVVVIGDAEGTVLRENNIHNSSRSVGLNATASAHSVDARRNWWGCPNGPDHPACDDVIGNATYSPWLTESNPGAGAF